MPINVHTILTLSDWFYYYGSAGSQGLYRICDLMKESGLKRIYLRTHEGGKACYPSRISTVHVGKHALDNYQGYISYPKSYYNYVLALDYSAWDPVALFPDAAEKAGIEPGLWYTIMEDDHGGHVKSDFVLNNPHYRCVRRDGSAVDGCLEFWFPAVRDYKQAIVDELLDKGATHLLLDLVRRNGMPSADADGLYQYGFNPEIVAAFKNQTGLNAHELVPGSSDWGAWLSFVSKPTTDFLIDICRRIKARGATVELMSWPVDLKQWMGIDLPALLDTGVIESVHVQSQTYSYSPAELDHQLAALKPQVADRNVRIVPSICGYEGIVPSGLDDYLRALDDNQVSDAVIHESDVIPRCHLLNRFRALNFNQPHFKRTVNSAFCHTINWDNVPAMQGFLRAFNEDSVEADQLTELQATHTSDALHIRITCHERNVKRLLPVPAWEDNYNVRQLKARTFWSPIESVHVFLSPPGQYEDYFHFVLDPSGQSRQERRVDESWSGRWEHDVQIHDQKWVATFIIPFDSINHRPAPGQQMAFHAVRAQANPLQITALNLTSPNTPNPIEYGFLNFDW